MVNKRIEEEGCLGNLPFDSGLGKSLKEDIIGNLLLRKSIACDINTTIDKDAICYLLTES